MHPPSGTESPGQPRRAPSDPAPPDPEATDPAVLGALLARHGWQRRRGTPAPGTCIRWTPPGSGPDAVGVLVPESRDTPRCTELLTEALTALTRSTAPSAREILLGLAAPSDEVHWTGRSAPSGTRSAGSAGSARAVQEQLGSAVRAMLLAAALAGRGSAGYFGARHRQYAERFLEQVLLAGPVPGRAAGTPRYAAYIPVAGGRTAPVALRRALRAAREATDQLRATGSVAAFDAAVDQGVCQELVESLAAMVRAAGEVRIALHWSPAAGVPEGGPARPEPVEFCTADLSALKEAARHLVRVEPSVPVRVAGSVVRLRRAAPGGPGAVRLHVLAGAEVAQVRVALDEDSYRTAAHAHLAGLPILLSGRLESRGGFRRITGASEVVPVPAAEAELRRRTGPLRESLTRFERNCGSRGRASGSG